MFIVFVAHSFFKLFIITYCMKYYSRSTTTVTSPITPSNTQFIVRDNQSVELSNQCNCCPTKKKLGSFIPFITV